MKSKAYQAKWDDTPLKVGDVITCKLGHFKGAPMRVQELIFDSRLINKHRVIVTLENDPEQTRLEYALVEMTKLK